MLKAYLQNSALVEELLTDCLQICQSAVHNNSEVCVAAV